MLLFKLTLFQKEFKTNRATIDVVTHIREDVSSESRRSSPSPSDAWKRRLSLGEVVAVSVMKASGSRVSPRGLDVTTGLSAKMTKPNPCAPGPQ